MFQRLAILLHRPHNDLAISPELLRRVLERNSILLHSREHDLAIGTELGCMNKKNSRSPHPPQHNLAIGEAVPAYKEKYDVALETVYLPPRRGTVYLVHILEH